MIIWRDPSEVGAPAGDAQGRAVAIGAFDGVHLGHQAVLRLVHDLARARRLSSTVLTFDRHPAEVVRPASAPKLLTTLDQKLELLDATGSVDECLVLAFDAARSKEPAEDFVSEVLAGVLGARLVVVGADFHFGYKRHGDVALLQHRCWLRVAVERPPSPARARAASSRPRRRRSSRSIRTRARRSGGRSTGLRASSPTSRRPSNRSRGS